MSPETFALLQRLHGHLAVLGLAVLLHPVLTLSRPGYARGTRLSARLALLLVGGGWLLGLALYPDYRSGVKPGLLAEALPLALAFETKEHLAFFTLALVLGGVCALELGGASAPVRRAARTCLGLAWLCGLAVAALGITVAAGAAPAW